MKTQARRQVLEQPDIRHMPDSSKQWKTITGKKRKQRGIVWTLIVFFALLLVISRYSILTQMNYDIATLSKNLQTQQATNSNLTVELNQKINLPLVRYLAQTQMGMTSPEAHQIVYVEIPRSNRTVVADPPRNLTDGMADFLRMIWEEIVDLTSIFG